MEDIQALEAKYQRLVALMRSLGSVVVAFSGGVDSTFLARAAREDVPCGRPAPR